MSIVGEVKAAPSAKAKWMAYVLAAAGIALLTLLRHLPGLKFDSVNAVLLYLFPVLLSAVYGGKGVAVFAASGGILAFDFYDVPPRLSFTVEDLRYLISFAVYLAVALLTAGLADGLKRQVQLAKLQERHTAALYLMSRRMSDLSDLSSLSQVFREHIQEAFGLQAVIYSIGAAGSLLEITEGAQPEHAEGGDDHGANEASLLIARWVFRYGEQAGHGTGKLRDSPGWYLPLRAEEQLYGVLELSPGEREVPLTGEERSRLESLAGVAAGSMARIRRGEEAKLAQLTAESERMRTALLDSVSHELRTPLAAIIGSAGGLIESDELFSPRGSHGAAYRHP